MRPATELSHPRLLSDSDDQLILLVYTLMILSSSVSTTFVVRQEARYVISSVSDKFGKGWVASVKFCWRNLHRYIETQLCVGHCHVEIGIVSDTWQCRVHC